MYRLYHIIKNKRLFHAILIAFCGSLLAGVFSAFSQPADPGANRMITLAVMDFKNTSEQFSLDRLERNVPEMLKTELSQSGRIIVVERRRLEAILNEQVLGLSGVIDEEQAQKMGKLLGAQYIITGEITLTGRRLRIDSHIQKTETGQVIGEKVIGRGIDVLNEMVQLLARNIIFNLTGSGSKTTKITLGKMPINWFLGATALSAIGLIASQSAYTKHYDDYQAATGLDDFDSHYDKANQYKKFRDILIGPTAAFAITTFVLWLVSKSNKNEIIALENFYFNSDQQKIALGLNYHNYACYLNVRCNF